MESSVGTVDIHVPGSLPYSNMYETSSPSGSFADDHLNAGNLVISVASAAGDLSTGANGSLFIPRS
ncbi:hypothetical protein SDC9_131096 [bioreactor metagenome]|uniref:Uncharacterized protein n=1 Tax=bioreactor metagenome TaxID=1076179 RepID=A0A645D3S4_9ZZZZ